MTRICNSSPIFIFFTNFRKMVFWSSVFLFITIAISIVECNTEGDALHQWRTTLIDPEMVLASWDPTFVNPCPWHHVTCNIDNSVIRVDLGSAGLSGTLVPQLGQLVNLQYLQVSKNQISGEIPSTFGNLRSLVSLGLDQNNISGTIPSTLGNLKSLRILRLDGNKLTGAVPPQLIQLALTGKLQLMNVSNNNLAGTIKNIHGTEGFATAVIVQDPRAPK